MDSNASSADLDPVDALAEEYLNRRRRGERPTPGEYAARYPEHAARILELLPALEFIEGLKPTPGDDSGQSDDWGTGREPAGRPRRLGDYTLLRELGRGGMGIVYEAEHESLKNRVALKVMHPRYRADRAYLRRFQTEPRSAAKLHHTNIVPVFDYGEQDGVFYYAMQCIVGVGMDLVLEDVRRLRTAGDGDTAAVFGATGAAMAFDTVPDPVAAVSRGLLTGQYAIAAMTTAVEMPATPPTLGVQGPTDEAVGSAATTPSPGPAPPTRDTSSGSSSFAGQRESIYFREVARLGAQVADALDYAHRQGVVHRDIKPSNLLLDSQGNVWVTDFGLAKLVESEDLSRSQDVVGTLRFIAPERFRGITSPLGDVYSLGATLYELLTLNPAFADLDQARLIERITHGAAVPLRHHDRRIPRDLETLVQKALATEPKNRFARAADLGDELRRCTESRPIKSRPVGPVERLWRWGKRSPGLAAASIGAAALTVVLLIVSTIAAWTFRDQRDQIRLDNFRIQTADRNTRENLFEALTAQARATRFSRQVGQRFESLHALQHAARIAHELGLPPERFDSLRDAAIACLALPDLKATGRVIKQPAGTLLFCFDSRMSRYAVRLLSGTILVRRVADDKEIARFQGRGDRDIFVFAFGPDGRYLTTTNLPGYSLTVWNVDQGTIAVAEPGPVPGTAARFSPDSRRIALAHRDGEVLIYDLGTGRASKLQSGQLPVEDLAFRPDGAQIAVTNHDSKRPTCRILEVESGRVVRTIALRSTASVAWGPDGTTLATPAGDFSIDLWDAPSGLKRARLDGSTNGGLHATFLPAGKLLASNGWEGRLRLWDAVLGRPVLSLTGVDHPANVFSPDGQIVLSREGQLTTYQVDPGLEYQTLMHVSREPLIYQLASIHRDNRLLAVGTKKGVVFWDLARGTECALLPIDMVGQVMFEASGDLFTSGAVGVLQWPVQLDPDRGVFRIGPPRQLLFARGAGQSALDRSGRIIARAKRTHVEIQTSGPLTQIGPLDECRYVDVSPDGQWLATGSHHVGAQVWRIRDHVKVAELPVDFGTRVTFSPAGKWLLTGRPPSRLWTTGPWTLRRELGGEALCFSPDSRLVAILDASKVIRLVEAETGHVIARLESPDSTDVGYAAFTPDGSRLVLSIHNNPAVHVWDLRAVRRGLVALGLDWDAPAYSEHDPADPAIAPLPPLQVDLGSLLGEIEHYTETAEALRAKYTARIQEAPNDVEAYHHRGHAFFQLRRLAEAIDDLTIAVRLRPDDAHLRETLAAACNNRAWELAIGPESSRDTEQPLTLARRAVALAPNQAIYLNTLGVAQYRACQYARATATLERSLAAGRGESDAFDLFFLAMAHHRQGNRQQARDCFDRAVRWLGQQKNLSEQYSKELATFRSDARSVLAGPAGELPVDAFGPLR